MHHYHDLFDAEHVGDLEALIHEAIDALEDEGHKILHVSLSGSSAKTEKSDTAYVHDILIVYQ